MATPVKPCDTEPGFSFSFDHYIKTPPETTPSMFRFNSDDSLKTISVRDMSEESSSDSIDRVRREDEYQTMSKKEEASTFARLGHDLSMNEVFARANEEKAVGLCDWGQLYEYETGSMSDSKDASSTPGAAEQDNICDKESGSQTMVDHANPYGDRCTFDKLPMPENMDDVLRCFLMLSKEVSTTSDDDALKLYAAKETELLVNRLVGRGFDKTKIDVLDDETTAAINCRVMHSRHRTRLEWLRGELASVQNELECLSEEVKETVICSGTEEEERKRQIAQDKRFSSKLGKLARTWQAVVENDLYAEE
ncbi:hypothetical protein PV11_00572 [Exophiala sideris]|uniref:Uncharacterized protein n=1 Tax=Exophiala sideris TaxID=1016849 RepID=A0A0D1YPU1_9EURO|nr:hypothetical protein PV11_00572 [Exophiala sideris]